MKDLVKSGDYTHELFGSLTTITNGDGEVFFIGKQVSDILGYRDFSRMKESLDADEIMHLKHSEAVTVLIGDDINSRGIQLLTESGLYEAILGSKKQEAKKFKKWVTKEVLPSIRKTGSYSVQTEEQMLLSLFPSSDANLIALTADTIRTKKVLETKIEEDAPKVDFANSVADSSDCIGIGEFSKVVFDEIKLGRNKMFKQLRSMGLLKKNNEPYQKHINSGVFKTIEQAIAALCGVK